MNRSLLVFAAALLIAAAPFSDNNGAAWAAESGGGVRNKNFRVLCELTAITKDGPKASYLNAFWLAMFRDIIEKQLNADGRADGNTFKLVETSDEGPDADFQFGYRFDDTKGTAALRLCGKSGALIREFKATTKYPTEDVMDKMKVDEAAKFLSRVYADLNHQAYVWIRDNGGPGGSK